MTTKEKLRKFYEEHEEAIQIGARIAATTIIGVCLAKLVKRSFATVKVTPKPQEIKLPVHREITKELMDLGYECYGSGDKWIEFANYGGDDIVPLMTVENAHKAIDAATKLKGFNKDSGIQLMFNVFMLDDEA